MVFSWFLVVALHLASTGQQEYHVTQQVLPSSFILPLHFNFPLINPPSIHQPWSNCSSLSSCLPSNSSPPHLCSPDTFSSCTSSCPGVSCTFVKNVRNSDYSWLQVILLLHLSFPSQLSIVISLSSFTPLPCPQAVNMLGLYWGLSFCSAFSDLVLASAFSRWFWTWDKRRLRHPVTHALWATTIFHLGTAAFGSLIITMVR